MKRLALIFIGVLLLVSAASASASFTPFTAYGDAWKSTNDTMTIIKWNATGLHQFSTSGNATTFDILNVAGGASGGCGYSGADNGGGGGAGGVLAGTLSAMMGSYNILVGSGGAACSGNGINGTAGGNSSIYNATSFWNTSGGGPGGRGSTAGGAHVGLDGGSAGGAGAWNGAPTAANGGISTQISISPLTGYGFGGGQNSVGYGGGGGGAGGAGVTASAGVCGNGTGIYSNITGTNTLFAWGGSGFTCGVTGVNGFGSGGQGKDGTSDAGGSGVVIIRFLNPSNAPIASFTSNVSSGDAPLGVQFTDTSVSSITSWNWTFGDIGGSNTSTLQNPTHTYNSAGAYTVSLNVTNASGYSVATSTITVSAPAYTITPLPVANMPFTSWNVSNSVTFARTTFDSNQAVDPMVVMYGSEYRIYYSGFDSTEYKFGMVNSSTLSGWSNKTVLLSKYGSLTGIDSTATVILSNGTTREYYKGLYGSSPYNDVRCMQSLNGLDGWNQCATNPVIVANASTFYDTRFDPEVIIYNASATPAFVMIFGAYHGGIFESGRATSNDGISWTINPTPVLTPGSGGSWDSYGAYPDAYYKIGNTIYLIYQGIDAAVGVTGNSEGHWRLGIATSTDNGLTWSKYAGNPVVNYTPGFSRWSSENPSDPIVTPDGNNFFAVMCAGAYHMASYDLVNITSQIYPTPQNGYIYPMTNQTYNGGETPTFNITPGSGYVIQDVKVDGVSVGAVSTYTFSAVGANHNITATFSMAGQPLSAAFTQSPNPSTVGQSVTFTDTSTGSPNSWNWSFGDTATSTLQNPTHTYATNGTFTVGLNVTNATGASSVVSYPHTVTGATSFTQQDIWMLAQYTLRVHVVDSNNLPIVSATMTDTATGTTYSTSNGTVYATYPFQAVAGFISSVGYQSKSFSTFVDRDTDVTVQLAVAPTNTTPSQNTWWTPHTVQITLMDASYGFRLTDVQINATYNESSMPAGWIEQLYGIQANVGADMVNKTLSLGGTTGSDGTLTTTMLGSIKYDIFLTSAQYGLTNYHVQAYPSDPMLNIYVATAGSVLPTNKNSTYVGLNGTRVYMTEPDIHNVTMCIDYVDTTGLTSSVTDTWMFQNNDTVFNTVTFSPGTSLNTSCYTLPNIRGTMVWWGYNASRSV